MLAHRLLLRRPVSSSSAASPSARAWAQRHARDHFVQQALRQSLRSRAAFKLLDILQEYPQVIPKGASVLDLGAAPGGWSQVAIEAVGPRGISDLLKGHRFVGFENEQPGDGDNATSPDSECTESKTGGRVLAVDLLPIDPIPGVDIIVGDMKNPETLRRVLDLTGKKIDSVISDMSHSFTGTRSADVVRVLVSQNDFNIKS
ncbi:hypothetical protein HDU83_007586 [Entophlyctis luteolus]|nr:hypothetical protein HDU83_007586 [Entophlyctis luteolus]